MADDPSSKTRLTVLAVLGGLIGALLAYRRRAFARYAEQFHGRYG